MKRGISVKKILFSIIFDRYISDQGFELSNYGVWLKSNSKDKSFHFALHSYRNGLDKILTNLKSSFIFLDIGANQGIFSLIVNTNKHCKQIICFEPNIEITKYLRQNLIFNQVPNFRIFNYAISRESGCLNFFISKEHSGDGHRVKIGGNVKVPSINQIR
jgi:hypothetical protein